MAEAVLQGSELHCRTMTLAAEGIRGNTSAARKTSQEILTTSAERDKDLN